ncbi:MAG TPA: tetratricopeptide repeat protein [Thermoanaerobaculia bacterium]|nr:tetratricopeptide repeat protein [Thermoanaerobaculia bacterium]
MWCQSCGARNSDDAEHCERCECKLLVISGSTGGEEEIDGGDDEGFSFDEHLLERISILEEVLKRTGETVRSILAALHKQEENILVNHAGLATVRDLLERKGVVAADEWSDLWESKLEDQLVALERRDRFRRSKDRIAALYGGDRRELFVRHLEEAEYALYAFELERATHLLESAFKLDRGNFELAHLLGETHFHDGRADRALACFSILLDLKPDHFEGLVYRGVLHHHRGESAPAEESLRRAVSLYPNSFLPLFCLGATLARQGSLGHATAFLERAVALDPVPEASYLLGSCLYEMGQLKPAVRALQEAIRLDPSFEDCYHLLGLCYLDRQWHRKALEAFRQAQRLNPKKLRYDDLVRYLSGRGELAEPPPKGPAGELAARAESLLESGDTRRALRAYQGAVRAEPDNAALLVAYALACLKLNRSQEIRSLAERVIALEPGEMLKATAYATLIAALRGEGKYREGNRVGRRLLEESTTPFSKTIAYYEMAYNLAEMDEDLDLALTFARRSLDHAPDELRQFPLAALGWVHYKRREYREAIDWLSRSTELDASATAMTHLGMALLASGERERARSVLSRARQLDHGRGALGEKLLTLMKDSARLVQGSGAGAKRRG